MISPSNSKIFFSKILRVLLLGEGISSECCNMLSLKGKQDNFEGVDKSGGSPANNSQKNGKKISELKKFAVYMTHDYIAIKRRITGEKNDRFFTIFFAVLFPVFFAVN